MMVSYGQDDSVYYESAIISVDGVLETHIFPGRPNYEDIAQGDEPEKCFYLRLDEVISNVIPDPKETYSWTVEHNIGIMQLSMSTKRSGFFKDGDHVRLTGSLYQGFNAHHHTRVLISVDKIELLARNKGQVRPHLVLREGMLELE
jgi:hypothetical protein